ncbi:MAG: MFS transporter [Ktedonobacteraceae bacterium]|nr:MFS transporter [Ktedonobacteraceae bacterium]MBO0791278.1 MFS transporter [Ktedonobacteraceae bacterium]
MKILPLKNDPSTHAGRLSWLINRNFALVTIGGAISGLGDAVYGQMINLWLIQKVLGSNAWGPLAMSAFGLFAALPGFILGPWAGVFVDRWVHRRTMMIINMINALLMGVLILVTGSIPLPWHLSPLFIVGFLCLEILLLSICGQFSNPASDGLFGQIVPKRSLIRAKGVSQILNAPAALVGPLLGTFLYFTVGMLWGLVLNAFSFVVWLLTLWVIRVHPGQGSVQKMKQKRFWPEFVSGLRFSFKNRAIRIFILSLVILNLGTGLLNPVSVFFLKSNLHADLSSLGLFTTIGSAGSILGYLVFGCLAMRIGLKRLLYGSLLGMGILQIIFSRLSDWRPALVITFMFSAVSGALNIVSTALLIGETPNSLIGRVSSVMSTLTNISSTIAGMLGGYLASVALVALHWHILGTGFGKFDTIYAGAGILFFLSGIYTLAALRGVTIETSMQTETSGEETSVQSPARPSPSTTSPNM